MLKHTLTIRIVGFLGSLILTLAAFALIFNPGVLHLNARQAVIAILVLAFIQFIVQFLCFIDTWRERGATWNLFVFFSFVSIVLIIILGSIWIMDHLDCHMMMS